MNPDQHPSPPPTPDNQFLGQSLDEMREEVWVQVQANHPGLTKAQFLELSEAFGF